MSLAPDATLALSPRADDEDSWNRNFARRHRILRPSLEAALGFGPDVVVRYWGGEPRLLRALERRGVRVVTIEDAIDMGGVRNNIAIVAKGLHQAERGQALIARMDNQLAQAAGAGQGQEILYMTPGGYTGARGTLIDAILRAAGFRNRAEGQGFVSVGIEALVFRPPIRVVQGFYSLWRSNWRGPGRHPVVVEATRDKVVAELPASTISCPAWFAAEASAFLAAAVR